MNALLDKPETVVPSESDAALATESSRILAQVPQGDSLRVQLENGQVLTLPRAATRLLAHLLIEMSHGNAVTLIPIHAELTTQEAAEYLHVSRPYLIRLLEQGRIPFHKVGTHRRVRFRDLQAFKEQAERDRAQAMDDLAADAQRLGMGY
ncbi:MAG: helix-turn-helix domain-containing protein [Alphaproteobacteria bacterium]